MTEALWSTAAPTVAVERHAPARVRTLRLRRPTEETFGGLHAALGAALPDPGHVVALPAGRVLWTGLHEWLVVGEMPGEPAPEAMVAGAAAGLLSDITDALVAYRIGGPDAPTVLAKGCTLDFHPRVFAASRSAQTAFAQAAVAIERLPDGSFTLYADRSYARHLDLWFEDAVIEFRSNRNSI